MNGADLTLHQNGKKVPLNIKYSKVLYYLLERAGDIVAKDDMLDALWTDIYVSDSVLTQAIKEIRKVLSDSPARPVYIKTRPKRGYQFVAEVLESAPGTLPKKRIASERTPPFQFNQPLLEPDAALFFGREKEISILIPRILSSSTLLISGRSGVGKTSLLHAGLVPELKKSGCFIAFLTGKDFCIDGRAQSEEHREHLRENLTGRIMEHPEAHWIVIFDQLEDIFQSEQSWSVLERLLEHPPWLKVKTTLIFSIREESLAEINRLKYIDPDIFHREFNLGEMDETRAAMMVEKISEHCQFHMDNALITKVTGYIQQDGKVSLPLLHLAFARIIGDGEPPYTTSVFDNGFDIKELASSHFQRFLSAYPVSLHLPLKTLLSSLLQAGKDAVPMKKIRKTMDHATPEPWSTLMKDLMKSHILKSGSINGHSVLELTHELFRAPIATWIHSMKEEEGSVYELFQRGFMTYTDRGFLLERNILELVLPDAKHRDLSESALVFLGKSCLKRGIALPPWLSRSLPHRDDLLGEALVSTDSATVLAALDSLELTSSHWLKSHIPGLLYDMEDRKLQRHTLQILCERFPGEVTRILYDEKPNTLKGWWCFMTLLALARDASSKNVPLFYPSIVPTIFLLFSLAWVRIRREKHDLAMDVLGGTLGGCFAGGLSGAIFSLGMSQSSMQILPVFFMLGVFAGGLGAFAISSGFVLFRVVAQRHGRYWPVPGGILSANLLIWIFYLGFDTFRIDILHLNHLSSCQWPEISILSLMILLGATVFSQSKIQSTLAASLSGGLAGFFLNLWDGNLFIRSTLQFFEGMNAGEAIHVSPLGMHLINPMEGALFGLFLMIGIYRSRLHKELKGPKS